MGYVRLSVSIIMLCVMVGVRTMELGTFEQARNALVCMPEKKQQALLDSSVGVLVRTLLLPNQEVRERILRYTFGDTFEWLQYATRRPIATFHFDQSPKTRLRRSLSPGVVEQQVIELSPRRRRRSSVTSNTKVQLKDFGMRLWPCADVVAREKQRGRKETGVYQKHIHEKILAQRAALCTSSSLNLRNSDGCVVKKIPAHYCEQYSFSPDGNYLISAGKDSLIKTYKVAHDTLERVSSVTCRHHTCVCSKGVQEVGFSPDGQYFATLSACGRAMVYCFAPFTHSIKNDEPEKLPIDTAFTALQYHTNDKDAQQVTLPKHLALCNVRKKLNCLQGDIS